jgi:hypothetical protein
VTDPQLSARYDDEHRRQLVRRLTRKRSDVEFQLTADSAGAAA